MSFYIGQRVRLKMPKMTNPALSKTGTVVDVNGAYVAVRPSRWPKCAYIWFYPGELKAFKKDNPCRNLKKPRKR